VLEVSLFSPNGPPIGPILIGVKSAALVTLTIIKGPGPRSKKPLSKPAWGPDLLTRSQNRT
jgi:hypothetical protein